MAEYLDRFYETSKKVSVEWEIQNFLSRTDKSGWIPSPIFLLSDERFYIGIYHKGESGDDTRLVYLHLRKKPSQSEVRVEYNMGLKRADGSIFKSYCGSHLFPLEEKDTGFYHFIERSQLTKAENIFGSEGTLTAFCEARVEDDAALKDESPSTMLETLKLLSKNFENIFVSGCYPDVLIDVKGKKFSAHRSILSARSSVFRSMFELEMKEKESGSVNITDCEPESFGSFLLFLYSGRLDVVTSDNVLYLYATAEKYNVQDLKKACREQMVRDLCTDSVCDVLHLAALHEEQELMKIATTYFVKNASAILKTSKWQTLVEENFTLTNALLIKMANKCNSKFENKDKF